MVIIVLARENLILFMSAVILKGEKMMKIERIKLVNFGNHADTDINLEQINIFVGPNGAGKSTIKQALEYLLAGRVYGVTDAAGRGADVLVRTGEKSGYVAAVVDGLNISRETGGKLQGMGEPPSREVISALLNTSRFLDLPAKEQQALLFSLLGLSFDREKLARALQDYLESANEEDASAAALMFEEKAGDAAGGPEVFDRLYKLFYNERTGAKRALKEMEALAKQESNVELPPGAWDAREKIRTDLQAIKERCSLLMKQLGQVTMQLKHRQDVEANIPRLEQEKRELEEKIAACWTGDAAAERNADQALGERIEDLEKEKKELQGRADEALKIAAELKAAVGQNEKLIQTLQEAGDTCPLLSNLTCPANKQEIAEEIAIETEQVRQAWEKEKTRLAEVEEKIAALDREIKELQQKRQAGRERFAQVDLDRKRLADVEERLEYFRQQLEEMEQVPAPVELQQEIDELGERIVRGEELVRKLAVHEDRLRRHEELQERLERARAEVAALEVLVEAFGPKGIRAKLLDEVIERLQARADERMQLLTSGKYRIKFAMPEFAPVIEKDGVPVKKLSTGERLMLGVVMQDILAGLAGARLLVIDDLNHLDQRNKNALVGMLLKIREDYDTIMAFSALGEVAPRDPGIPGVAVWMVQEGQVARVPAQAAA